VGLLIRQARTGGSQGLKSAEVDKAAAAAHAEPRVARTKDTPAARARIKEERAKAVETMNAATPEKKEEFRDQLTKHVTGRRGGKRSQVVPATAPQAQTPQTAATSSPDAAAQPKQDANTPASPGGKTNTEPSTDKTNKTGSESGKAGPG
jgi:hypothetical protein